MKRILFSMLAMLIVFVLVTPAHAFLINRGTDTAGNRLIYDDDLDITWYDYTSGATTWQSQVNWADALSVDFGGDIFDDWRLPTTDPEVSGYDTTSEMGHLFYTELGGSSGSFPSDTGDFLNLNASVYWSGTEYSANTGYAWDFFFSNGLQTAHYKVRDNYGLAVRSGDVAAVAVPEPTTIALLGIGLAGMGVYGVRRRRQLRYKES